MPRTTTPATKRSRKPLQAKAVQHRHFRLTPHPHRHMDIVTMAVLIIGIFIELVIMTSVPLGVSLFQLRARDLQAIEPQFAVRSQYTYERWYRDEIASIVPPSFFNVETITPEMIQDTKRIHEQLLAMRVPRFLQDVHLGLVILTSRKQEYIAHVQDGLAKPDESVELQNDLTAFVDHYPWLRGR